MKTCYSFFASQLQLKLISAELSWEFSLKPSENLFYEVNIIMS